MNEASCIRQAHPHLDPRQPRTGVTCDTNPPVFVWKPPEGKAAYRLVVCRDAAMRQVVLDVRGLPDPMHLPEKALPPGRYYWRWSSGGRPSEVFWFDVSKQSVVLEVPPAGEWLRRMPTGHPRTYVAPEQVTALRASRTGERAGLWKVLKARADEALAQEHELAERPFLPPWEIDYQKTYDIWLKALNASRTFVVGAHMMALAYLASGDERYGLAACRRMASVSRWDPEGSSHIAHNDETHMSLLWWGTAACDWAWDLFTPAQRESVIDQFRRRGEITFDHMRNKGCYGVTRFNSHSGREIVFLANLAMVFHEHIPAARRWLEWLRPVLCGIWPIWAGPDGAWAEGIMYGYAYVNIMTMFASALKHGADVDLYRRPFWRNHGAWRQWCHMPYAQWVGFGDQNLIKNWNGVWVDAAAMIETIARETGAEELSRYARQLHGEAAGHAGNPLFSPHLYLLPVRAGETPAGRKGKMPSPQDSVLRTFPGAGWAAIRTDLSDAKRDIAMVFRSSPYGSISHSHANNNDFVIHAGGKVLVMPSGYYPGYGGPHHVHWTWQTKAHNCVTFSDIGQLVSSYESTGSLDHPYEDASVAYFRGTADASYRLAAERCRRHVLFLKEYGVFVMVDEFVEAPGVKTGLQWNLHSWERFAVDRKRRRFSVRNGSSKLSGHVLFHYDGFFSQSEGWDPPPGDSPDLPMQYHLRFSATNFYPKGNFGVILACEAPRLKPPAIRCEAEGDLEQAWIGKAHVMLNPVGGEIVAKGRRTHAVMVVKIGRKTYKVTDDGMKVR